MEKTLQETSFQTVNFEQMVFQFIQIAVLMCLLSDLQQYARYAQEKSQ